MKLNQNFVDEINVLMMFSLETTMEGIKVHSNAEQGVIDATRRLFEKGLVTQEDGGYLTALGTEATEHASALLSILTTD